MPEYAGPPTNIGWGSDSNESSNDDVCPFVLETVGWTVEFTLFGESDFIANPSTVRYSIYFREVTLISNLLIEED